MPETSEQALVIEGCAIATVAGVEYASGHVVVDGEYIAAVASGPAPEMPGVRKVAAPHC